MEKEASNQMSEMIEDKSGKVDSDEELIRIRKDKLVKFFKTNYNWIAYIILAVITYIAVKIRTSNLAGLKDITTGTWTLGPDLDPFLFLRWAKYIVANGHIMAIDTMRYVPLGFNTNGEYLLHPYLIAWFHKIALMFGSQSVTQSAVLFPAFFFGLTVVAFFFMTRIIFIESMGEKNANVIALIASFFFSVMPIFLPRTIAGIPEKESSAFLFLFLAFYFFIAGWKAKSKNSRYINAVLAGLSTAAMAHIWGGFVFIFISIAVATFAAFLLGKVDNRTRKIYVLWIVISLALMIGITGRHALVSTITSSNIAPSMAVLCIILIDYLLYESKLKDKFSKIKANKVPRQVISTLVSIVAIVVLASILFGPSLIFKIFGNIKDILIKPATSRLIQTVAENRQPYFTEWGGSFGPYFRGFALSFWLFFIGSIYLFNKMIKTAFGKKEGTIMSISYFIALSCVIFSRYSASSKLNGENFTSNFVYFGGLLVFFVVQGYYYYQDYKINKIEKITEIDFGPIMLFSFFFLSIVAARAAVRTIMVLVPPASIIIGYFVVVTIRDTVTMKDGTSKFIAIGLTGLILIASLYSGGVFYQSIKSQAPGQVPYAYTQQWQKAMSFVRESTPQDAVFGHWWDYGYWLQSIGERATVLDGGNAISYWNHMMGRYALTGTSNQEALEFLYAHNTTHFLIDSTDIGKYGAFSSIGSDASYDRASYIPTFMRDQSRVSEKKNSTVSVYNGGVGLDEDIIYELNGTQVFLPAGSAGIAGVLVDRFPNGEIASQPIGVYVYQGKQYEIPMKYIYDGGKLTEFDEGIDAGVFIYPAAVQNGAQVQIDIYGAMFYLSKRTVNSQLARLYLYKEDNPNFKLVHSEDDFLVAQIKSQNPEFKGDMIQYQGFRGPIRIWEIEYPDNIEYKDKYISTVYPEDILFGR